MNLDQLGQLREQLESIARQQDFFAKAKEAYSEIPPDTKKALARKWVSKAKELSEGKLTAYEPEHHEIDHRRVIRLEHALRCLDDLEADLIRSQVEDLADLIWLRYTWTRRIYEALNGNWGLVRKVIVELWQFIRPPTPAELIDGYKQLIAGVATVGVIALEALTAKAFMQVALSVAKEREKCISRMRKLALPQPPAKRYRRRKRAR